MAECLSSGDPNAPIHIILAHGAGAPMTSPWMETMSQLLSERGHRVTRIEFAYMSARSTGTRRPPPRIDRLVEEYLDFTMQISKASKSPKLIIGGKSMGGRVATLAADKLYAQGLIAGVVCLGYPFHPPKAPLNLRTHHLADLKTPTLVVQGDRDAFGTKADVANYRLSPKIEIEWIGDGDHDFSPRKSSGKNSAATMAAATDAITRFANQTMKPPQPRAS